MKEYQLPTVAELRTLEFHAKCELARLFEDPTLKQHKRAHRLGMKRLSEKGHLSRALARHMHARKIQTIEELADLLFIGPDYTQALEWMRHPSAFRARSPKERREYLLSLCDLEWDPASQSYVYAGKP